MSRDDVVAARLARDRVTGAGYVVLATWGWFLYGFGAMLPQLGRDQGISRSATALHSLALTAGALVAGLLAVRVVRLLRRRGALLLGTGLMVVGTLLLVAAPLVTAGTLTAMLVVGTGGSLLVNTITPTLDDHHQPHGATALAEGNAVAAGVGLLAPLAVGAGIQAGLGWQPAMLIAVPLALAGALLVRRPAPGTPALDAPPAPPRAPGTADDRLPVGVWPLIAMLMSCVGIEFCITNWSAELLREEIGLTAGAAAAGVSAALVGMTAGRLLVGRLALRVTARRLLAATFAVTLLGFTGLWLAPSAPVALAGLVVVGLGIAGHYPLSAALVMDAAGAGRRDRAAGRMSVGVGLSAGAGPLALGALADATSTHTAFLVVPVLVALAAAMLLLSRRVR